jgi:hypothetical protein
MNTVIEKADEFIKLHTKVLAVGVFMHSDLWCIQAGVARRVVLLLRMCVFLARLHGATVVRLNKERYTGLSFASTLASRSVGILSGFSPK